MYGELLFEQDYDVGEKLTFYLYRKEEDGEVTVTLTYLFDVPGEKETVCKRIFYPIAAEGYKHELLSWYNLICCSNNYGPIPVTSYMNYAVQNGKKPAATIYPDNVYEYRRFISDTDDSYYCFPFHPDEYEYLLFCSLKGSLSDLFDLDKILEVYSSCGIDLDKEKMSDLFSRELSWFANEAQSGIEIHNCLGAENLAVTGLLFGYPVESTVALINKTIDMCE